MSPDTPEDTTRSPWLYWTALVAVAVLGWFAFIRGVRVPLLGDFDLGIHELGHMLSWFMPRELNILAGSGLQALVPLGLAAYFGWGRKDLLATGLMLAWAGTSLQDVSVYVADAPFRALPLLGGGGDSMHDWWNLLRRWDLLDAAGGIAATIKGVGLISLVGGAGAEFWGLFGPRVSQKRDSIVEERYEEYRKTLPVRTPRNVPVESDGSEDL